MEIPMRLKKLRQKMEEAGIDIYFIPTNDYHGSEYVSDFFKTREYIFFLIDARLWPSGPSSCSCREVCLVCVNVL